MNLLASWVHPGDNPENFQNERRTAAGEASIARGICESGPQTKKDQLSLAQYRE
jgi:hypothetical protein